jgi:hypothetical protein
MILYYNIYYVNKNSKDRQQNCQKKKVKTIIYKTLHRKLKIEHH